MLHQIGLIYSIISLVGINKFYIKRIKNIDKTKIWYIMCISNKSFKNKEEQK